MPAIDRSSIGGAIIGYQLHSQGQPLTGVSTNLLVNPLCQFRNLNASLMAALQAFRVFSKKQNLGRLLAFEESVFSLKRTDNFLEDRASHPMPKALVRQYRRFAAFSACEIYLQIERTS